MSLMIIDRMRTLLHTEDILGISDALKVRNGVYNAASFVGYAEIEYKIDFLRTLFLDPRTQDLFWKESVDFAMMGAVRRDDLDLLNFFLEQIDETNERYERARKVLFEIFVGACQLGHSSSAQYLLTNPTAKIYINPFDREDRALRQAVATSGREPKGSLTENVIRRVLLPLYDDQNTRDVLMLYDTNPVLLDTFFHDLSPTKQVMAVDLLLKGRHLTGKKREELPSVKAFLDKQEIIETLLPKAQGSVSRKRKLI